MMVSRYKWWVVCMLWFVCLFNYADRQAIYSVFPLLKGEMGLNDVELGFVGSSFMWVYALALPAAGVLGDRFRRKTLILAGLIFWSLITVATACATEFWHLLLFRALEGFGEALYFPASMSLISDYHGPATRSRAMAWHQSSVYAGTIAGGYLAGFVGENYGWRSGFYLFGSLGIVLGVVLLFLLREPERTRPAPLSHGADVPGTDGSAGLGLWQVIRHVLTTPGVQLLILVFMGANFVAAIFLTWMPTFLYEEYKMSLAMAGLRATAYSQIAMVLGVLSGGILADRLARRYRRGRMMSQAFGLFGGIPFLFLIGWTQSEPVLALALIGFGYFKGVYDANIWAALYDEVAPQHRATALGLMNAIGWVGAAGAPVAIAAASEHFGMSACLSATSLIYLVFGIVLACGVRASLALKRPAADPWRSQARPVKGKSCENDSWTA